MDTVWLQRECHGVPAADRQEMPEFSVGTDWLVRWTPKWDATFLALGVVQHRRVPVGLYTAGKSVSTLS